MKLVLASNNARQARRTAADACPARRRAGAQARARRRRGRRALLDLRRERAGKGAARRGGQACRQSPTMPAFASRPSAACPASATAYYATRSATRGRRPTTCKRAARADCGIVTIAAPHCVSTLVALRSPEDPEPLIAAAAGRPDRPRAAGEQRLRLRPRISCRSSARPLPNCRSELKNAHSHRGRHRARCWR